MNLIILANPKYGIERHTKKLNTLIFDITKKAIFFRSCKNSYQQKIIKK